MCWPYCQEATTFQLVIRVLSSGTHGQRLELCFSLLISVVAYCIGGTYPDREWLGRIESNICEGALKHMQGTGLGNMNGYAPDDLSFSPTATLVEHGLLSQRFTG